VELLSVLVVAVLDWEVVVSVCEVVSVVLVPVAEVVPVVLEMVTVVV
jgi:hypothetical protein